MKHQEKFLPIAKEAAALAVQKKTLDQKGLLMKARKARSVEGRDEVTSTKEELSFNPCALLSPRRQEQEDPPQESHTEIQHTKSADIGLFLGCITPERNALLHFQLSG